MADLLDLQEELSRRLSPYTHLVWKWYPDREDLDLAVALHPFRLPATEISALVESLRADFPSLAAVSDQNGFLNLQFHKQAWAEFVIGWRGDLGAFVSRLGLSRDLADARIQWPYRWLLVIHEAHVLAGLPGWTAGSGFAYAPTREEMGLLKQLMALPGILQQKGDSQRKRTEMMQGIFVILQSLWKQPILTATDPDGSAFRQALIVLAIGIAEAVGKPLSQAPNEGLNMPP